MNTLHGTIVNLQTSGDMTLVEARVLDTEVKSIVLETPSSALYLQTGNDIKILFKETEVIIGKGDFSMLSLQNRFNARIQKIEKGELLSRLVLEVKSQEIVSIITTKATEQMDLKPGDRVSAMIKTNEIMLSAW